jgi:hypothetical protein
MDRICRCTKVDFDLERFVLRDIEDPVVWETAGLVLPHINPMVVDSDVEYRKEALQT